MTKQKLRFSTLIDAPKEAVWHAMLDDAPYREWTSVFSPGSHYTGDWSEGSSMTFIGPDPDTGKEMGMVSRIAENRTHEYISIEHRGMIRDGVEDTTSDEAKKWLPAFENYTFTEKDGATEVIVEMDTTDEYAEMFNDLWPKALKKLKEIAERE